MKMMSLVRPLLMRRGFSTSSEKMVASVLFERLPVVIPKIDPNVYAFQEFSFRWRQQYQRRYPDEFLDRSDARGKGDYQIDYVPAPRITEADKQNDRRSLQRALDRRLYLLLFGDAYGAPSGKPVWHFPEKVYESEDTMRKCAESALKSVLGDLSNTYFVGNAPMAHIVVQPKEEQTGSTSFKVVWPVLGQEILDGGVGGVTTKFSHTYHTNDIVMEEEELVTVTLNVCLIS
ncbi:39S ribosomal protein L46, mitochondrial isoform X2 [Medicago truncatula]|uniref:39S ribosomal protein L46, mitochondrial isoform X2 n=1 Tax=Medicago truncatula TaxID=3880 RepID=UPI000D2F3352|nr:39S ribosomal protein L46, mitochondrial isoform X2 [Medicago truncatula]